MNLAVISVPRADGTALGSASLHDGSGTSWREGIRSGAGTPGDETESALNRLSRDIARAVSDMSEISSGFSESRKVAPAKRLSRTALRKRIYSEVQAFIKIRVETRLPGETLEAATVRVARELGLTYAEVRGIRNGDKRRIDEDILVILRPFLPSLLSEQPGSENPEREQEISGIRAALKDALARLDRLEPA